MAKDVCFELPVNKKNTIKQNRRCVRSNSSVIRARTKERQYALHTATRTNVLKARRAHKQRHDTSTLPPQTDHPMLLLVEEIRPPAHLVAVSLFRAHSVDQLLILDS